MRYIVVLLCAGLALAQEKPPHTTRELRAYEREAFQRVNDLRVRSGVPELVWDEGLAAVARQQSEDMGRLGFFSHENPQRGNPAARLTSHGVVWANCGENIFRENGYTEPGALAAISWWFSAGHRLTLLNPDYTRSGIGLAATPRGDVFATQIFVKPRN